ncbi:MAG: AAA family ATPase, partial [Fimbriimonas ginsengisoli]|nr:AAA family ATPase [Fimbriimonas ginsengisoli]
KREEAERLMAEYEEAYQKLTAPANRIGVFLQWLEAEGERVAMIAVGDQEFVSQVDPVAKEMDLSVGSRIKVNDAYAIVGALPVSASGAVAKVAEVMEGGRLRVGSEVPGSESRLILRGAGLEKTTIRIGDEVRLDPSGRVALEHYQRKEARDYFLEEVPELPWEMVGGQDDAIKLIRETIEMPLLHPELFAKFDKKPIKGILLYGPPGCGKTLIGKATAHNLTKEYAKLTGKSVKEYFMAISGPKILNMWLGETERMVREIFATARERAKEGRLVFIFMDEAESVLRTRSGSRYLNISNTVVPQFCAELDGLVALDNVVLMLTSNRPDYIDPAVLRPERIDRKVKVSRPNRAASEQILGIYLHANVPLDPAVLKSNHGEIDCARMELIQGLSEHLWRKSPESEFLRVFLRNGSTETLYRRDLVSGALLKSIVDRAKDFAIKRSIARPDEEHGISAEDLTEAAEREFKENEIFPKGDAQEDWLQLLDYAPENVASVRPVRDHVGERHSRKGVH